MNSTIRLKDITWGGRIRTVCQSFVWDIASEVAIDSGRSYSGNMLSSRETFWLRFLDGGISHTFGSFDASSGMHWHGERAKAYILYRLGLNPGDLLGLRSVPTFQELEEELRGQRELARRNGQQTNADNLLEAPKKHKRPDPQRIRKLLAARLKKQWLAQSKQKAGEQEDIADSAKQPISEADIILVDPWLKKADKTTLVPHDARHVCSYQVNLIVDCFEEKTYFLRTDTTDELWIRDEFRCGCVLAVTRQGKEVTACLRLMDKFLRAKVGYEWPSKFTASGLVNKHTFDSLIGRIEDELEENIKKAKQNETEIIKVARELRLSPEPTGTSPTFWRARCPETNHPLYINAAENSFGCGWCKRKGEIEELRRFVKERKDWQAKKPGRQP
jgi:hypothetical protein